MMRVTELQSVIAELTRKLNEATGNKIIEEDEDVEESQCSSDLDAEEGKSFVDLMRVIVVIETMYYQLITRVTRSYDTVSLSAK